MTRQFSVLAVALLTACLALPSNAHAEELHLVCIGKRLIAVDIDHSWSNEIIIDLATSKVIKFETTWKLAAGKAEYAFEATAEIDATTIKIYDRVVGAEGEWEKVIVISRTDGSVEAIVTKTGAVSIE